MGDPGKMQHRATVGLFFAGIGIKIADFPTEGMGGVRRRWALQGVLACWGRPGRKRMQLGRQSARILGVSG